MALLYDVASHKTQDTTIEALDVSPRTPRPLLAPVGLEMKGFHPILFDIAQRTGHTGGAEL